MVTSKDAEQAIDNFARAMIQTAAFSKVSPEDAVDEADSLSEDYETYVREVLWTELPEPLKEQLEGDPEQANRVVADLVGVMYRTAVFLVYPGPQDPEIRRQLGYWEDDRLDRPRTFSDTLEELKFELGHWRRRAKQPILGCGGNTVVLLVAITLLAIAMSAWVLK